MQEQLQHLYMPRKSRFSSAPPLRAPPVLHTFLLLRTASTSVPSLTLLLRRAFNGA